MAQNEEAKPLRKDGVWIISSAGSEDRGVNTNTTLGYDLLLEKWKKGPHGLPEVKGTSQSYDVEKMGDGQSGTGSTHGSAPKIGSFEPCHPKPLFATLRKMAARQQQQQGASAQGKTYQFKLVLLGKTKTIHLPIDEILNFVGG